ncbi:hypothetical protein ACFFX0_18230 [Citricoccus parietis]|uniref:Uncharacterized protein n=1 Tax=Citricoccus parietis TaxID=592307 RepID=A0ABV5G273_9MICC
MAGGSRDRAGPAEHGEGCFGVQSVGVVSSDHQQLGSVDDAHARGLQQLRIGPAHQLLQVTVVALNFTLQGQNSMSQISQGPADQEVDRTKVRVLLLTGPPCPRINRSWPGLTAPTPPPRSTYRTRARWWPLELCGPRLVVHAGAISELPVP